MDTKDIVLQSVEQKITLKNEEKLDPKVYYQDRDSLYVYGSFKKRILPKAEVSEAGASFDVASYTLTKDSTDEQIEFSLPEKHFFTDTEVSAVVAALIGKQQKGEEEAMLTNGNFNLFYTEAFVVSVDWFDGGWRVRAWFRGGGGWRADDRLFSPVN